MKPSALFRPSLIVASTLTSLLLFAPIAKSQDEDAGAAVDATIPDAAVVDATVAPPPPLDASPIEPPSPVLGEELRFDISGAVKLVVLPPYGWTGSDTSDLDIEELTQVSGSEALVQHTWSSPHPKRAASSEMFVVCASAPANDWAPGMESLVVERLNVIAKAQLAKKMAVASFSPGPIEDAPPVFRQSFEATGKAGGDRKEGSVRVLEVDHLDNRRAAIAGNGRHVIGFLADPERVLVCSTACIEPVHHTRGACAASVASFRLDGPLAPEPSPSMSGRLLLGIKRRPTSLLGAALGLMLALVGVLAVLRGLMIRPTPSA